METAASHTSVRMRMVGPSEGERRGVRTGGMSAGMMDMGVWIGSMATSRDHKQIIPAEKTRKSIIVSGDDGKREK